MSLRVDRQTGDIIENEDINAIASEVNRISEALASQGGTSGSGILNVSGTVDLTDKPGIREVYATASATVEGVALAAGSAAVFRYFVGAWTYMVVGEHTTWQSISATPVTANVPTADDTANTITWTPKAGVQYVIGGTVRIPPYSVGDVTTSVTVTAQAATGYVLTGPSSWTFNFTGSAPADTTPPTGGSLAVTGSGQAGSTRTLTVTGASDAGGLHTQPYRFSTNGGTTWSTYQTSNMFTTGALSAGTYQPRVMVRDAAGNTATASAADFAVDPAPAIGLPVNDTFTGPDQTLLTGRTVSGFTYALDADNLTKASQQTYSMKILGNAATGSGTTGNGANVLDVGRTNVRVSADVTSQSDTTSAGVRLALAGSASDAIYCFVWQTTVNAVTTAEIKCYRANGTQIGGTYNPPPGRYVQRQTGVGVRRHQRHREVEGRNSHHRLRIRAHRDQGWTRTYRGRRLRCAHVRQLLGGGGVSLLALIAAHAAGGADPDPPDPPADTTPYVFPATAPWNVPIPAPTPTPEGTGEAIHPSVVDFQTMHDQATWNGYRYWMAMTPYPNAYDPAENPCILTSHDGYTWVAPSGLTNPIDPWPGVFETYNSDTDLVFDPDTGRLWCYWRESGPTAFTLHCAWSTNGTTWTKLDAIHVIPRGIVGTARDILSPSVVRLAAGSWVMYAPSQHPTDIHTYVLNRFTATAPRGPWTYQGAVTWSGSVGIWHVGIRQVGGVFYGLVDSNGGASGQHVYAVASVDGLSWSVNPSPVIAARAGMWDARPYRAHLTPHENGTHMRVWYSATAAGTTGKWATGYTQIPLSEWPTPPP